MIFTGTFWNADVSYRYRNDCIGLEILLAGPSVDGTYVVTSIYDDAQFAAGSQHETCANFLAAHLHFTKWVLEELQNETYRLTAKPIIERIARKK